MVEKTILDLGDVQKTLFLPLWGRATESRKEHPILVDKSAVAIMQQVDYDFSTLADNINELTQIAWIMRSVCTDNVVKAFLQNFPRGTIVNIGCGLDTTFDRVDNGTMIWYDLDLPDVICLRKRFIQANDRRRFIAASFLEREWLHTLEVREQILFIAAGVFYYFEEREVRDFLTRQANLFPGSELLMDVCSPYGVKVANEMVIRRSGLDERSFLKWGLKSPKTISGWDKRFRLVDTHYYFRMLGRSLSLKIKLLGFVSDLLKIQYIVHLKVNGRDRG